MSKLRELLIQLNNDSKFVKRITSLSYEEQQLWHRHYHTVQTDLTVISDLIDSLLIKLRLDDIPDDDDKADLSEEVTQSL